MSSTLFLVVALLALCWASPAKKIPIIIDTDIGGDFDDSAALALALQLPNIDIKLVLTSDDDATARARIVAKYLEAVNRTDVPVGVGKITHPFNHWHWLFGWAADYDLAKYPGTVYMDGDKAAADIICNHPETEIPIQYVAISEMWNIPPILKHCPTAGKHAEIKAMMGSINPPSPEHNARGCVNCTKELMAQPWNVTFTPLDTCAAASLHNDTFKQLLMGAHPVATTLMECLVYWASFGHGFSLLKGTDPWFDTVAVYMAATIPTGNTESFLEYENVPIVITDKGATVIQKGGKESTVAIKWKDLEGYRSWLAKHIALPPRW